MVRLTNELVLRLVVLKNMQTVLGTLWVVLVLVMLFVMVYETRLHVKVQHIFHTVLATITQSKIGTCFLAHKDIIFL